MKNIYFICYIMFSAFHTSYPMIAKITTDNDPLLFLIKMNRSLGSDINEPYQSDQFADGDKKYDGLTALQIACQRGCLEITNLLLFFPEINVDYYERGRSPALHTTIQKNGSTYRDITRLLIHHSKINLNLADSDSKTPLHIAAQWNNEDAVENIIDIHSHKVNPNLGDNVGNTPLHIACDCNHPEIVTKLFNHPIINIELKNNDGKTPFTIACDRGFIAIAQLLLLKECFIDTRDNQLNTPLHYACSNGNTKIVSLLIRAGASTELKNKHGNLAIVLACINDMADCVNLLLQHNPQLINVFYHEDEDSLLHTAIQSNSINTMKVLLKNPSLAIYTTNAKKMTPLHLACYGNHLNCVNALLAANVSGIDLQRYFCNQTALHIAADHADAPIIELLIQKGANPTTLDENKETPLVTCYFKNKINGLDSAIVQQMVTATDNAKNTQFHLYAQNNPQYAPFKLIENYLCFLSQQGLSVWTRNKDGKTAADIAYQDYISTYQFYLSKPLPTMKVVLDNQERVMHAFLHITSEHICSALFKKIFKKFHVLPEMRQRIMRFYYQINVETIIARQYKDNRRYYDQSWKQKNDMRQKLIENPHNPHLLW